MNELANIRINGNAEEPITRREFAEAVQLLGRVLGQRGREVLPLNL